MPIAELLADWHAAQRDRVAAGELAESTWKQWRSAVRHASTHFGGTRAGSITVEQVRRLRGELRGSTWNHTRHVLVKAWEWGAEQGFVVGECPAVHVPRAFVEPRHCSLTVEQYAKAWRSLEELEDLELVMSSAIDALRVLIYTGARKNEIAKLRREQVDIVSGIVLIGRRKGANRRYLLCEEAREIVARRLDSADPWIFPGRKPGKHVVEVYRPWQLACKRAGLPRMPVHGLRHAWVTTAAQHASVERVRVTIGLSGRAMVHQYSHLDLLDSRGLVEQVSQHVRSGLYGAGKRGGDA